MTIRLLSRNPVFSQLNAEQIDTLARSIEYKRFREGDVIMQGGDLVNEESAMFLISEGVCKLVPSFADGKKQRQDDLDMKKKRTSPSSFMKKDVGDSTVRDLIHPVSPIMIRSSFKKSVLNAQQRGSGKFATKQGSERLSGFSLGAGSPNNQQRPSSRNLTRVKTLITQAVKALHKVGSVSLLENHQHFASFMNLLPGLLGHAHNHEDMTSMLGESDGLDYAVIMSGDSFGEECILGGEGQSPPRLSSVFAVGGVSCIIIKPMALKKMGVFTLVRQELIKNELGEDVIGLTSDEPTGKVVLDSSISSRFLQFEEATKETQRHSVGHTHTTVPPNEVTGKDLFVLKNLHRTEMTSVYVALHKPTRQLMVAKSLNVSVANHRGLGTYVLTEQSILSQLTSPFVTHMLACWEEPQRVVLGLEPALGGDLQDLLKRSMDTSKSQADYVAPMGELGGFKFEHVRFVFACCVLALKHLYENDVIHRDMKPCNLIMDHHGYVKLVDFGIAKQLTKSAQRTYTLCGTPSYMSPELARLSLGSGEGYSMGVDWWSLGVCMVELATGLNPFAGVQAKSMGSKKRSSHSESVKLSATFRRIEDFTKRDQGPEDEVFDCFRKDSLKDMARQQRWNVLLVSGYCSYLWLFV